MPKIKTKFTAQFSIKLGKTPVDISIPVDFTQADPGVSFEDYVQSVQDEAASHLSEMVENANLKLKNQGDLKKAHKAFVKASASNDATA